MDTDVERKRVPNRRPTITLVVLYGGVKYHATASWGEDGRLAEVFLEGGKVGSELQYLTRDAGLVLSLALQHGCTAEAIRASISRQPGGLAAGPIGAVLDEIERMEREWSAGGTRGQPE